MENAVFVWDLPVKNDTLPETNIAFGNRPSPKNMSSSNHQLSRAMLVSGMVPPSSFSSHPWLGSP